MNCEKPAPLAVVVQFDKEASQTRLLCRQKRRFAARPDSLDYARDRLFAAQKRLAQDGIQTAPLPRSPYRFSNAFCNSSGAIGFTLTGLAGTPATM